MGDARFVHRADAVAASIAGLAGRAARATRLGAGTSLPGRVIERIDPGFLARRARSLRGGIVVVSGTNGKTTTASMIAHVLRAQGRSVLANGSGANLRAGIAATLLDATPDADVGVFEIDEAVVGSLVPTLGPAVLVLTNVFRDQLDRFAEPEAVAGLLRDAARSLPPGASLIANADDATLWAAVEDLRPVGFGVRVDDASPDAGAVAGAQPEAGVGAEPEACARCGAPLEIGDRTIANLGASSCPSCGWRGGRPAVLARVIAQAGVEALVADVDGEPLTLPVGGLHNAYNAVAAVAAVRALGVSAQASVAALEGFEARFGRGEELERDGRIVWLGLVKNPAGAAVVLDEVASDPRVGACVVAISDQVADGRDVSWIWDVEFERLVELGVPVVVGGRRSLDAAVRMKYAGAGGALVETDPGAAVAAAVAACPVGRRVAVLATYTAMLDVRGALLGDRSSRVLDGAA